MKALIWSCRGLGNAGDIVCGTIRGPNTVGTTYPEGVVLFGAVCVAGADCAAPAECTTGLAFRSCVVKGDPCP